jgi:SAM-dependent methyltransferase
VFAQQAGNVWVDSYDFADETGVILGLVGSEVFDLLDVGASSGGLLKALSGFKGRRSALDIVTHPGLDLWVRGEFIHGLADSEDLSWSEEPYDIVTMFDVAEHLYDPNQAFNNLQDLVKPEGFVVVETGDSNSDWPRKFGVNRWWYACRFEHHILWSRQSFENIAAKYGFRILTFQKKRHKERATIPMWRDLVDIIGIALYRLRPTAYGKFVKAVAGKTRLQPWSPFTRDHFRVILQRR